MIRITVYVIVAILITVIFITIISSKTSPKPRPITQPVTIPEIVPKPELIPEIIPRPEIIPEIINKPVIPPLPNTEDAAEKQSCEGVIDFSNGLWTCLTFDSGVVISSALQPVNTTVNALISNIYPASVAKEDPVVLQKLTDSFSLTPFPQKEGIIIRTTKAGSFLYENKTPIFYDTEFIEVLQLFSNYKSYQQTTFIGCWFDYCRGSGCFVKTNVTCMAYNSVHLLHSLGIPNDKIILYASTVFVEQLKSTTIEKVISACLDPLEYVQEKWNYCNFESKPMRYIVWMAAQKGYRTIQLSNEWDGKFSRRIFIDIRSFQTFYKNNPFSLSDNPKQFRRILYDSYRKLNVDDKYITGTISNVIADPWIFQNECRLAGGSTAIFTNIAQCKKIIRFGMTPELLATEKDPDFSLFLQSNDKEKLRSYFTIVYGYPDVWKNQTLQQLMDRWDCGEVRYIDICKGLNLTLPFAVKRQRQQMYHTDNGPQSSIEVNFKIEFKRVIQRCAEQLTYIEVFRQGKWASTTEDNVNFAGTYYFPCRGSGYYLPMGDNWFTQRQKNDFFKTVNMPELGEPSWEQDKPLASALLAHGVDVMLVTHFMGFSTEVIDSSDVITSLSKLVKTHPFDPLVNQPIPDEQLFTYPYKGKNIGKPAPVVKRQFNALSDTCA